MTCVVLPAENRRDFLELPGFLRDGLEVHFAAHYRDVFPVAFPAQPRALALQR